MAASDIFAAVYPMTGSVHRPALGAGTMSPHDVLTGIHAVRRRPIRILATLVAALAAAAIASPVFAAVTVGATVKDTAGGVVGQVASVSGSDVIVDTGKHKVTIPQASFGGTADAPLLAMTKSQLDAAYDQAIAEQQAKLTNAIQPGATVRGTEGGIIGTIAKLDGDFVMVKGEAGEARIPASGLSLKADGLHFGMSAAQFAEAVRASTAADPGSR
jgi:preprotein translocase subunit YajC